MYRTTSSVLGACLVLALASPLVAQTPTGPAPVGHAVTRDTQIAGVVVDDQGHPVVGVSVLALGASLVVARSDDRGRFVLSLPPGPYVLRAARDGYVSTYRDVIQVTSGEVQHRDITLARVATGQRPVQLASMGDVDDGAPDPAAGPTPGATSGESSQSETAWRLRHLPRTVLRDESGILPWDDALSAGADHGSVFDTIATSPSRTTASFLGDTDFTGHVDFLTTSSLSASGTLAPIEWPRGVAYVVFGAPVGVRGDWTVRAALTAGDLTSWTFLGEYQAHTDRAHAFRTGVAYSAQALASDPGVLAPLASPIARRVGGAYLDDRWTVTRDLEFDYGVKIDRYDYLANPNLISGSFGARARLAPRTVVVARLSPHMTAPGSDQFLPPATAGVWLPPERTFSSLDPNRSLDPERVNRYDLGVETRLGAGADSPVVRAGRFAEMVSDQIATVFGLDGAEGAGHYFISSPGDVLVTGWVIGFDGPVTRYLKGRVDYRATQADWSGMTPRSLRVLASSAARSGPEAGHDLTTSLQATVPGTSTHVNVAYRMDTRFAGTQALPGTSGRFKVEVAQQLPFQPLGRGELNVLFSVRTLLREVEEEAAYYDELLTVDPPLRITCGLQMRF